MKILFVTHDLRYADHIAIAYLSAIAKQLGHNTYFCTLIKERFCIWLIKRVPPNKLFISIRKILYNYYIKRKIFKLYLG